MATNKNTALKVGAVRYVGLMLHIRWAGGWHLGGLILAAGAYHFDTSAQLTGALTLNAQGDSNARFVF